jgi:hypothetical protein
MNPVIQNTSAFKRGRNTKRGCFLAKANMIAISKTKGYVPMDQAKAYTFRV